jgi:translation initiation factor IF-2
MSRIRVLDLAKELNIDTKTALAKLGDLGIQVKNHFNAVGDSEADKLRVYIRSGRNPDKEAAKSANKVIIRRRAETPRAEDSSGGEEGSEASSAVEISVREPEQRAPAPAPIAAAPVEVFRDEPPSPSIKRDVERPPAAEFSSRSQESAATPPTRPETAASGGDAPTSVEARPSGATASAVPPPVATPQVAANASTVTATSKQESSVKPTGSPSAPAPSATILRSGPTPPPTPAPSAGATVLSRPQQDPSASATIVRQAPQPGAGATIIRRGEVPGSGPGVSTYRPEGRNQTGYRSDSFKPEGGYRTEGGGYSRPARWPWLCTPCARRSPNAWRLRCSSSRRCSWRRRLRSPSGGCSRRLRPPSGGCSRRLRPPSGRCSWRIRPPSGWLRCSGCWYHS